MTGGGQMTRVILSRRGGGVAAVTVTDAQIDSGAAASGEVLTADGAGGAAWIAAGGGLFDAVALIRDEKAANTAGGTFTSGAWQTRVLNTEVSDADGIVSLASNQFTLQAGTYLIHARAPGYQCDRHKAKLRNVTDSTDALIGSSAWNPSAQSGAGESDVVGVITIASAKAFEIQHRCATTQASNGFGIESNFGVVEVYTEVEIWRFAA